MEPNPNLCHCAENARHDSHKSLQCEHAWICTVMWRCRSADTCTLSYLVLEGLGIWKKDVQRIVQPNVPLLLVSLPWWEVLIMKVNRDIMDLGKQWAGWEKVAISVHLDAEEDFRPRDERRPSRISTDRQTSAYRIYHKPSTWMLWCSSICLLTRLLTFILFIACGCANTCEVNFPTEQTEAQRTQKYTTSTNSHMTQQL